MRSITTALLLALVALPAFAATLLTEKDKEKSNEKEKFVIYYADTATLQQFRPFQMAVLDSTHHPAIQPLKEEGKTLLGYLSLGEVDKNNPSYAELKKQNLILQENPNWKDSFYVDLRDPLWAKMVIENIVPAILRQGFDGVFLDTLDDAVALEEQSPEKYAGMRDAATHIVQGIRMNYPRIKIMMNRGYGILAKAAPSLDMELAESLYGTYDFNRKTYRKTENEEYHDQLQLLKEAKHNDPKLKIYSLDYAAPSDTGTIKDIYRTERENGFVPYVATIGLDKIVDEPGSN